MPDLPEVTQEFTADVSGYLAGVEEMIAATNAFRESVDAALISVEALHAAIDDLPAEKTIHINFETSGMPAAAATAAGAQGAAPDTGGLAADAAAAREDAAAADADAAAHGRLAETLDEVGLSYRQMVEQGILPADSALKGAADAAGEATIPMAAAGAAARDVGMGLEEAGADAERTVGGFGLLGAAATGIVAGFARVETAWKATNVVWGLSLNALHWIVMGSMELLAVAVPAMVALGAAGLVAMQGVQETGNRLQSIYTVTESLGGAFNVTAGNVLGLKSVLQQAQNAANPLVWEALGAAINGVKVMGGGFVQMGSQVLQIFDRWAAAVDIELAGAFGKNLTGILSKGAQDLTGFGQALGNIGHFIVNLASEMPGLAEVMLGAVAGFTKLLAVLTNPAWYNFGGNLVTVAMGIEEAWRWGGLLSNVLGSVITKFGGWVSAAGAAASQYNVLGHSLEGAGEAAVTMGEGMGSAGAVLSGPWGWVILGAIAGLTLLAIKLAETKTEAQQMVAGMEQAIGGSGLTQGFEKATTDLTQLQGKLQGVNVAAAATAITVSRGGRAWSGAADDAKAYAQGQEQIIKDGAGVIAFGAQVSSKFGVSVPDAFQLASMAGLKVNQVLDKNGQVSKVALQQIQNLIQGYQIMSGNSSALGNNINAVNYQLGLQNTQVTKLNSAWDNFMSVVTGGTSSWGALLDNISTMGNVTQVATSKIQTFAQGSQGMQLSVKGISQALTSFNGVSAQVWQNFDSDLTQANKVTDWWRTAAASGAVSGKQLTEAVATTTAQFVPYVGQSKTALAETMALAQQQGGPAYNATLSLSQNYQALNNWVKQNGVSQNQYNALLGQTTIQLSNVSQAAQQFSQTLQSDVAQAVAAGAVNLNTVTRDTQNFTTALHNNQPQSRAVSSAINQMAVQFHGAGMNAQSAAALVYQLGVDQGLTKGQAQGLANEMTHVMNNMHGAANAANSTAGAVNNSANAMYRGANAAWAMAQAVNDIPNYKGVYVNVQEAITGTVGVGGILPTPSGHAAGWRVPGYGGGDIHPALLEGGESVVPKELTPAVAPFLKSHGVPGFEGGGIMGSDGSHASYGSGGGGPQTIHVPVYIDGSKIAEAMVPYSAAAAGRYQVRNSGRATGQWGTGWKG